MRDLDILRKLADNYDALEELLEKKNQLIEKLREIINQQREDYKQKQEETQKELDELESKINELIGQIEALTTPPVHIGKLIKVMEDNTCVIFDNHRATYRISLAKDLKAEDLEEGCEIEYTVDPMSGKPLAVFAARKDKRDEELVIVKDLIDENMAWVVLPDDVLKPAMIARKVRGTLEKGDEVYYDPVINTITGKVPRTEEKVDLRRVPKKTYQDIGGLKEQVRQIREIVELPLKHPEFFEQLGIDPPKGILLTGPPGCGKTLIGQAIANECGVFFIHISGPEIISSYVGESEARLRSLFETARRYAPAIIFLDEIEAIAQKREEMHTGQMVEQRVVDQLLSTMDGLTTREKVVVIAATNVPDLLDPALRRPGRFDREVVIPVPDRDGRLEILQIHSKNMPLSSDVNLGELADKTHGFTGADLEALCKEAAMQVLKDVDFDKADSGLREKMEVTLEHFNLVLEVMEPSVMREVAIQRPTETWEDVGGLEEIKQQLEEAIKWPLLYPELLKKANQKPPKGIMLYGPPGCGKTLVARALANECGVNFIAVKGPELISKWVGESEAQVRKLFKRARQSAPCVIFFDEIEALVTFRGSGANDANVGNRVTSQLLTELDGIEELKGVFVLAATNRIDLVDSALLRPGRFEYLIYLPPPNEEARMKIFEIHTRGKPLSEDVDLRKLAKNAKLPAGTEIMKDMVLDKELPFSGDIIRSICQKATQRALREFVASYNAKKDYEQFKIEMKHFKEALAEVKPSVKASAQEQEESLPLDTEVSSTKKKRRDIKEISDEDLSQAI